MSTILYALDNRFLETIKTMLAKPMDKEYWTGPLVKNSALVRLVQKAERIVTEQDLLTPNIEVPKGKFILGIGAEWNDVNGVMHRKNSDLFFDHELFDNPMATLVKQLHGFGDAIIPVECVPDQTTAYAWTLSSYEGYTVLRICGQFK
ncbi:hypothetical protein MZD04_gp297 [Pseudomonas phage Psa21]|uniref:Uncharacterized protein n=1 Tax=Pseudomonas phage Psa21 TaxID=2530023 RepID=A0A481W609_9CAUD|nr:hypothetical protein MZD04_gp297 [Pseudomonas phage Psa21]QBJ02823.1 hypothetical protein PSA21_297 [Pseudomonas phage Psa21]